MLRRLLLLGLVLGGVAHAAARPHIELAATPAWKGWTRPGRTTEIDVRLTADATTSGTLDVVAGSQTVRADFDLQLGRTVRFHIPVNPVETVSLSAGSPGGPPDRREIAVARSESPLLGVGLATGEAVQLEGFHSVALAADDLPRNAAAYSGIDALILDGSTLGELDQRQLAALLAHAAECGRVVVLHTDSRVRRLLDGAGGCGGHALMSAASLANATAMLRSSLATSVPIASAPAGGDALTQPSYVVWNRVVVAMAAYFAAAALTLLFFASLPALLLTPALAVLAMLALLHAMQAPSQLVVWSEGASGAQFARYQAWQRFPGQVRERLRVPIPPQLASAAQPCDLTQPMRLDLDARSGRAVFAEFNTRLFQQVFLCYAGSFPMARAFAVELRAEGLRDLRNVGTKAWPRGVLLADGVALELPAVAPGARTAIGARADLPVRDPVLRTAIARTPPDGVAALWELDLAGIADARVEPKGWLLVSAPAP